MSVRGGLNASRQLLRKVFHLALQITVTLWETKVASYKPRQQKEGACHELEQMQLMQGNPESELLHQSLKCRRLQFCHESYSTAATEWDLKPIIC